MRPLCVGRLGGGGGGWAQSRGSTAQLSHTVALHCCASTQGLGLQGRKASRAAPRARTSCGTPLAAAGRTSTIAVHKRSYIGACTPGQLRRRPIGVSQWERVDGRKWAGLRRLLPVGLRGCTRRDCGGGRELHAERLGQQRRRQRGSEVQRARRTLVGRG